MPRYALSEKALFEVDTPEDARKSWLTVGQVKGLSYGERALARKGILRALRAFSCTSVDFQFSVNGEGKRVKLVRVPALRVGEVHTSEYLPPKLITSDTLDGIIANFERNLVGFQPYAHTGHIKNGENLYQVLERLKTTAPEKVDDYQAVGHIVMFERGTGDEEFEDNDPDTLYAYVEPLNDEIVQQIESGAYKKASLEFFGNWLDIRDGKRKGPAAQGLGFTNCPRFPDLGDVSVIALSVNAMASEKDELLVAYNDLQTTTATKPASNQDKENSVPNVSATSPAPAGLSAVTVQVENASAPLTAPQVDPVAAQTPAAGQPAAEKAEAAEGEKTEAEKLAAEKLAAEQAEAEKLAAEQAEAEKLAAEKLAAEKAEAEKAEAEKLAAEKAAAAPIVLEDIKLLDDAPPAPTTVFQQTNAPVHTEPGMDPAMLQAAMQQQAAAPAAHGAQAPQVAPSGSPDLAQAMQQLVEMQQQISRLGELVEKKDAALTSVQQELTQLSSSLGQVPGDPFAAMSAQYTAKGLAPAFVRNVIALAKGPANDGLIQLSSGASVDPVQAARAVFESFPEENLVALNQQAGFSGLTQMSSAAQQQGYKPFAVQHAKLDAAASKQQ